MEVLSDFNKVYISGFFFSGMSRFPCMLALGQPGSTSQWFLVFVCVCVCLPPYLKCRCSDTLHSVGNVNTSTQLRAPLRAHVCASTSTLSASLITPSKLSEEKA